jgi:hypothetical protein
MSTASHATDAASPNRFATDTAVERIDEARYRGAVDPGWAVIDGGYLMALAARDA